MTSKPLFIDGHQDIAYNMRNFQRDYSLTNAEIRKVEEATQIPLWNDDTLLGIDTYRKGKVALIFGTLFAAPEKFKEGDWDKITYTNQEEAHTLYRKQIDTYYALVEKKPDLFRLLFTQKELTDHIQNYKNTSDDNPPPIGIVLLMEGADAIRNIDELELWWELGVRIIGPAWAATAYCGGTGEPGGLTKEGFALIEAMPEIGFSLDLSHMDEKAVLQTLDNFGGTLLATHANAAELIRTDSNRHLSNRVIEGIFERDGVIGVVPFNKFLKKDWQKGEPRENVPLDLVANQIDYYCQIAGDSLHTAIGSDADGGFGLQSSPHEINTIADLHKLSPLLEEKGYQTADIENIFGGNWLRFLQNSLPE